nr:hypothetical protein [Candidatus Sigynarchaeum springense]
MRIPKKRLGKLLGVVLVLLVIASNTFIIFNPNWCLWGKVVYRARTGQRSYGFDGTISREVLESYLSRSITFSSFLRRDHLENSWNKGNVDDNFRCIANIGAKFIGRAIWTWCDETSLFQHINDSRLLAERAHAMDPELILQAAVFEAVSIGVESIPIPAWVFEEFGLAPEARNFSFASMYDVGGEFDDFWGTNTAVPDMSKLETRMWFFFLAATYIDMGIEALHLGQVALMTRFDPFQAHWRDMLRRVRAYAATNARRHMVLCDAHVPNGGYVYDCNLMFDFHSFPLRPEEIAGNPQKAELIVGHEDSIYKRSKGGIAPSGWACDSLPYLVEFDNFGISDHPGEDIGSIWTWGYDEITWYALQPEEYRNQWLSYAVRWLEENDPNGFLEMPGSRPISVAINGGYHYFANAVSVNMTNGFNQEETIKSIWERMPNL